MSDYKRKKQGAPLRYQANAQVKSTSSSSSALSHVDEGIENCSESSRNKNRRCNRRNVDNIRKIVQEEGRIARNLVTWNVPLEDPDKANKHTMAKTSGPSSPVKKSSSPTSRYSNVGQKTRDDVLSKRSLRKTTEPAKKSQQMSSKKDIRARYWAYLFENLHRAVDEIYQTCECDESVVECKEVIMMLDQYRQDFNSLIERLHLMQDYEKAGESSRRKNLAWDVRKRSPSKSLMMMNYKNEQFIGHDKASRSLLFVSSTDSAVDVGVSSSSSLDPIARSASPDKHLESLKSEQIDDTMIDPPKISGTSSTWADRVRSFNNSEESKEIFIKKHAHIQSNNINNNVNNVNNNNVNNNGVDHLHSTATDLGGWETVHRGGKQRQKTTLSTKSINSVPSVDRNITTTQTEVHSSTPLLHSSLQVILGLPSNLEQQGVSLEASVFDQSSGFPPCHEPTNQVSTASTYSSNAVEPNSETIFANCYHGYESIPSKSEKDPNRPTSGEFDDSFHLQALMEVLKEEDNMENLLDEENEAALESAMQEEKSYLQEIEREEMHQDAEDERMRHGLEENRAEEPCSWEYIMKKYEEEEATRKEETWADIMEEAEARTPGRLVHVFEKLSSPSRKRPTVESRRRLDEKQAKAAELRERSLLERGENLRILRKKVEEIQSLKNDLMQQARIRMEKKLQRAEEKRQILLQMRIRKAHEEDTKASEIAFINTLEAQNKKHDIMAKHQESEARLQDMQEERHRKHEEKAAKEAAAEERRKVMEAERMSRLQEMQDRRRQRETDFEQRQQEKEKERVEAARTRDREREGRMAALNKQQQAHVEELQKKIQHKQDETDRRHKEKLEAIQEKAFKMSLQHHSNDDNNDDPPMLVPYERQKYCSACNVLIPSEVYLLSHLRGKTHQRAICEGSRDVNPSQQEIERFNLLHVSDAPTDRPDPRVARQKERLKAFKKRCKKLKLRMLQRSRNIISEVSLENKVPNVVSQNKNKMQKLTKDLVKCINTTGSGPWAQSRVSGLDRCLGEMGRIFEKNIPADKIAFKLLGGLTSLFQLFEVTGRPTVDLPPLVPHKSLLLVSSVSKMLCFECKDVCLHLLLSNNICTLIDLISQHLNILIPDDFCDQQTECKLVDDQYVGSLIELLAAILHSFTYESRMNYNNNNKEDVVVSQTNDVVSYIVSIGIVDKISLYFNNIRGSVDGDAVGAEFLHNCLILVTSLVDVSDHGESLVLDSKKLEDPTQLILTLKVTRLVGIVSLMYGILLHSDAPARGNNPPPLLPKHTLDVAFLGFRMLNRVACLDLATFQSSLGEEGTSLEFRHIASYLLWYCNCCSNDILLHEVILCIGYFSLLNFDNQLIIQSGQPPTILQQLCFLPFQYFSDPKLISILFPTLICCCFEMLSNKSILEQELSCVLLSNFLEENLLKEQSSQQDNSDNSSFVNVPSSVDRFKQFHGSPVNRRMCLSARFPRHLWQEAQLYFSNV